MSVVVGSAAEHCQRGEASIRLTFIFIPPGPHQRLGKKSSSRIEFALSFHERVPDGVRKFNCSGRMIERACASLRSQSSKMSDDEEVEKVLTGACARILHWPICVHALFKLAVTPLASAPCCLALCTVLLLQRDGIARREWEGDGGRKRE